VNGTLIMKRNLTSAIGAGVLTLSMAVVPMTLSASAQTSATPSTSGTTTTTSQGTDNYATRNDGFDWGWLGLLGLFGLAGLAGRKRVEENTRYRDPNATGTGTAYRE